MHPHACGYIIRDSMLRVWWISIDALAPHAVAHLSSLYQLHWGGGGTLDVEHGASEARLPKPASRAGGTRNLSGRRTPTSRL